MRVWLTGRGSSALDSHEEGLKEWETQIYLSDSSFSTSPGLLHDLWVVGDDPWSGADPSVTLYAVVLHRWQTQCSGKAQTQSGLVGLCHLEGLCEALSVVKASAAWSTEHLSALRLSGGSQHLCLGLAWCAALGTVNFSLEVCSAGW